MNRDTSEQVKKEKQNREIISYTRSWQTEHHRGQGIYDQTSYQHNNINNHEIRKHNNRVKRERIKLRTTGM